MSRRDIPADKAALSLTDLSVSYGRIEALKKISLQVNEGEIIALLGANGAGKSSMLKAISGLIAPSGGTIRTYGEEIQKTSAEKIVKKGIIQSPEGRQVFTELSVEENLTIGGFTAPSKAAIKERMETVYSHFPRLQERQKQAAGTLSGGEQQMLAIGRALMADPKVLLLDEPSLGLAPLIVQDIFSIVKQLNKKGTTVLLVEQNAKQTLKIADYAYVLEVGTITMEGPAAELLNDRRVIDAYLGKEN